MSERLAQNRAGELLAVTTRSRLRGARFFPAMLLASWQVRRQLTRTAGLVRSASLIAGPTEFWTITVWRSRHAMQEFMRSGAHGRIMWRISRWLDSLWLMRWRPGAAEVGAWGGLGLAPPPAGHRQEPQVPKALEALRQLPDLQAAIGPDGNPRYGSSQMARRQREQVQGAGGTVIRISAAAPRTPTALAELVCLRRRLRVDGDLLRGVVGLGRLGEAYFLGIWRDYGRAAQFIDEEWVHQAAERWGAGFWAGVWLPENEFGHWDGLRLRQRRHHRGLPRDPSTAAR